MQYLIIMQGPSGSGKTTLANLFQEGFIPYGTAMICSTDKFFQDYETGKYEFKLEKLTENHQQNQKMARYVLEKGITAIIDNTNIRAWEARPYVEMAVALGVPVVFIRCEGKFDNSHGVPDEKVLQMRANMEELSVEKCLKAKSPWEEEKAVVNDAS